MLVRRKGDYGSYGGNGTLPETWIPAAELRDLRNLMHSRLALANDQTCLKNPYAGLVPVVHASGGHTFYGPNSRRSNLYLCSAFVEATNLAAIRRKQHPERHVTVTKKLLLSKKRIDDSRNEAATEEPIGAFRREAYDS